eukprot:13948-Heterococcus_DN1.PRE.3
MPPERICRRLNRANPDICAASSQEEETVVKAGSPPLHLQRYNCSIEHRTSLQQLWVVLE